MDDFGAIMTIECGDDPEFEIDAWQALIDSGKVWQMGPWYTRTAMKLIQEGTCEMPEETT